MPELKSEYHDTEILERTAECERRKRPYEYHSSGVEYTDLVDYFDYDDFGSPPEIMVPNRLKQLSRNGLLRQVYNSKSATVYRLTEQGWNIVDVREPDE